MKKFSKLFFFLFLIFFANTALAAELTFSPSSGSYTVGSTVKVRIVLSSTAQSANAVSGTVFFPKDALSLSSVSKTGSLVSLWPTEPSYSNDTGTIHVEGVILNGYQDSDGTIVTLFFKAKAPGSANIKFTSSSILANDGQGSNILTGAGQAHFNVIAAVEKSLPAPTPTPAPVPETPIPIAPVVTILTPVITDYSTNVRGGDFLVVKGLADPLTDILITSDGAVTSSGGVIHESKTVQADDAGVFTYVSGRVTYGTYTIIAQARNKDAILSDKSVPIKISIASPSLTNSSAPVINILSIIIPIIGLLILLVLLMIWGWHHILYYREHMRKRLLEVRTITAKSFGILDEDMKEEINIFKKIKARQPLTSDERLFINQFKKDIKAAEKIILSEVKE